MTITAVSLLGQQPPQQGSASQPSRPAVSKSALAQVTPAKDVADGAVKVSFSQRANLAPNAGGQNQQIQQTDSSRFGQVTTVRLSPGGGGIGGVGGGAVPSSGGVGGVAPPGAATGGGATIQFSERSGVCFVTKG